MGECYSCQSRSGKQTYMYYASDMSLSSNPTPYSGVRRFSGPLTSKPRKSSPNNNARIRNSNEQLATEEERAALATITNGPSNLASSNKANRSHRLHNLVEIDSVSKPRVESPEEIPIVTSWALA